MLQRPGSADVPGIATHRIDIPAAPTWRRVRAERRQLPAALRAIDADLLDHALLPLPRVPVPVCLTIHDLRDVDGYGTRARWLARAVVRHALRHATAVVVPSAFTAERLRYDAATIVPNGVELPTEPPRPPSAGPFGAHGYVLHVGHLEPRKNVAVVVEALARMPAGERPALVLAGRDAGSLAALQLLARRRNVGSCVHAIGTPSDDELQRLYAHARAVVLPSHYEGFGLPAIEGLAHGRPVLASDRGALPEVLAGHGVIVATDDAAGWADAIRATPVSEHDDDEAGVAARRNRAAAFAWGSAADRLAAPCGAAPPQRPLRTTPLDGIEKAAAPRTAAGEGFAAPT